MDTDFPRGQLRLLFIERFASSSRRRTSSSAAAPPPPPPPPHKPATRRKFLIPSSVLGIPSSVLGIPYSVFRIPYSVFRIPQVNEREGRRTWDVQYVLPTRVVSTIE